jgi:hypothetical protein
VLLLRKGSLLTVVFNLTPRALLDELIMLDRKSLADKLSDLNGWGHFSLSRHQLETGLRFRQPAVVEEVLRNLTNVSCLAWPIVKPSAPRPAFLTGSHFPPQDQLAYACNSLIECLRAVWDFKNMSGSFTVELRKLSRKFAINKLEVGRSFFFLNEQGIALL